MPLEIAPTHLPFFRKDVFIVLQSYSELEIGCVTYWRAHHKFYGSAGSSQVHLLSSPLLLFLVDKGSFSMVQYCPSDIVRILFLVPINALIGFASFLFWNHTSPLLFHWGRV